MVLHRRQKQKIKSARKRAGSARGKGNASRSRKPRVNKASNQPTAPESDKKGPKNKASREAHVAGRAITRIKKAKTIKEANDIVREIKKIAKSSSRTDWGKNASKAADQRISQLRRNRKRRQARANSSNVGKSTRRYGRKKSNRKK